MMKKKILSICLLAGLTCTVALPSFAESSDAEIFTQLKETIKAIQSEKQVQKTEKLSSNEGEFQTFKAYKKAIQSLNKETQQTEEKLREEFETEKVFEEEAKKQFTVSLDEARNYASEMREILDSSGDDKAKEIQKRLIEAEGVDEETYWNEVAPKEYQKVLLSNKLTKKLIEEGLVENPRETENIEKFSNDLNAYKEKLYKEKSSKN